MNCPKCLDNKSKVVDVRYYENLDTVVDDVIRTRQCVICGYQFTTQEKIITTPIKEAKRRTPPLRFLL